MPWRPPASEARLRAMARQYLRATAEGDAEWELEIGLRVRKLRPTDRKTLLDIIVAAERRDDEEGDG